MKFEDHYARAVRATSLKSEPGTLHSATDILGAAGLASKHEPLAMALQRLFMGDNHALPAVVEALTRKLVGKAYRMGQEMDEVAASLMARIALDWYRSTSCAVCGGLGFRRMLNAPTLSDQRCENCKGTSRRPYLTLFPFERYELASWLGNEIEREAAKAAPAAMAALASQMEL